MRKVFVSAAVLLALAYVTLWTFLGYFMEPTVIKANTNKTLVSNGDRKNAQSSVSYSSSVIKEVPSWKDKDLYNLTPDEETEFFAYKEKQFADRRKRVEQTCGKMQNQSLHVSRQSKSCKGSKAFNT